MSLAANKYITAFIALALALSLLAPGLANAADDALFNDISEVDPEIQADIQTLVDAGILSGYNNGTEFRPYDQVKRAQVAKIIVETMGWETNEAAANFPDVTIPEDKGYIGALVAHGVTTGYADGTFGPYDNVTRQQLASFFMRALGLAEQASQFYEAGVVGLDFVDTDAIDEAHRANVALANEIGFLKGYPDGTFGPTLNAARTALAKFGANLYVPERRQAFLDAAAQLGQETAEPVTGVALTDGPDLVSVKADGAVVTYTFDEAVDEVDENGFFLYTFDGTKIDNDAYTATVIEEGDADIVRGDETKVQVEFVHEKYLNLATVAGVEEGTVEDADGDANVEAGLPLNDVAVGNGQSTAPSLIDVDIDNFDSEDDGLAVGSGNGSTVEVAFTFDYELGDVANASKFILYANDGQKLVGLSVKNVNDDTVTVNAVLAAAVSDGHHFDEEDIVKAVVLPEAVTADDGGESNGLTAYAVKSQGDIDDVADLESVELDLKEEEITYKFDENVENNSNFNVTNLGIMTVTGEVKYLASQGSNDPMAVKNVTEEDDEITVEFEDGNLNLNAAVAAVVKETDDGKVSYSALPVTRSYQAGELLGPVLQSATVEEVDDEEVVVLYEFDKPVEDASADKTKFYLYSSDGDRYDADKVEEDDEIVEVTFEIDEDDFEDVVLAAVGYQAVQSDEDMAYSVESSVELKK